MLLCKCLIWIEFTVLLLGNNYYLFVNVTMFFLDYGGNASGARRPKKRSSGESPGDGQSLRSSGRQLNVRVKRSNNPPPGQVNAQKLGMLWERADADRLKGKYLLLIIFLKLCEQENSLLKMYY